MRKIFTCLAILLLSIGCFQSKDGKKVISRDTVDNGSDVRGTGNLKEESAFIEAKNDSAAFETDQETSLNGIQLIIPGTYHGDEIAEGAESFEWLGVFQHEDSSYVMPVEILVNMVQDGLLDEEGDSTGKEVVVKNATDNCVFILKGLKLPTKKIHEVPLDVLNVNPGEESVFNFLDTRYKLTATGKSEMTGGLAIVTDYELLISAEKAGKLISQAILKQGAFDETMISILWAGDVDMDGKLDLLIDTTYHYNLFRPTLFLSSLAAEQDLLIKVASFSSVGC